MLALAKLAVQPNMHPLSSLITSDSRTKITNNAYPVFAGMTWAMVMYIFRWHPETLASSLRSSMVYMYVLLPPPTICHTSHDSEIWSSLPVLTFISTTVMATQTIGIPSALYLYTTNELLVDPVLLAFVCVTAYRAGCYFVGVFVRRIRDVHHSGPCSSLPFYPILQGIGFLLAYFWLQYKFLKTSLYGDFRNWRYDRLVNSNMPWTSLNGWVYNI